MKKISKSSGKIKPLCKSWVQSFTEENISRQIQGVLQYMELRQKRARRNTLTYTIKHFRHESRWSSMFWWTVCINKIYFWSKKKQRSFFSIMDLHITRCANFLFRTFQPYFPLVTFTKIWIINNTRPIPSFWLLTPLSCCTAMRPEGWAFVQGRSKRWLVHCST